MRESDLWKYIREGLRGRCHLTRIESSAGNGVPDVSIGVPGRNVWVELKYIPEWPKRPTTKVKLPLRPEQKHWINARGKLSGDVWVLVRIANEFFLLASCDAVSLTDVGATQQEWYDNRAFGGYWVNRVNFDELHQMLMEG